MKLVATRHDERALRALMLGDPCAYCGGRADVLDHVTPRAAGGGNGTDNLAAACNRCNTQKAGRSLVGFMGFLANAELWAERARIAEQARGWFEIGRREVAA